MTPVTIGDATLYCADCADVLPMLGRVDLVLTDPPYGVGLVKKNDGWSKQATVTYIDDSDEIAAMVKRVIPIAIAIAGRSLIFPGPAMLWNYPEPAALGCVYSPSNPGRCSWGFQCSQPILFYGKDPYLQDGKGSMANSFYSSSPNLEKIDHPCPKPLPWMVWAVGRASRLSETVLDPFMGSGTTGVACAQMGRKFIGIEREPKYFDIACERIERAYAQGQLFEPAKPVAEQLRIDA